MVIPFHKLSKGAVTQVEKGWFHEAIIEMKSKTGKGYCIQCIAWQDKKQVCYLSSNRMESSNGTQITVTVLHGSKRSRVQAVIPGTIAQ